MALSPEQVLAFEALLLRDPGGRNVAGFAQQGQLELAARSLSAARRAVITSGFPVVRASGGWAPETDGPLAARALGDALRALGCDVRYVCGPFSAPVFQALDAAPLNTLDLGEDAGDEARRYLDRVDPTHLIAIERPGRARGGGYYSMSARSLGASVSAIDELFLIAAERGRPTTVGVGDGGNEVGLGALRPSVVRAVPHGETIASVVSADFCLVAGVSDWGTCALIGALSVLAGRDLLPSAVQVTARLDAVLAAGAVDGLSGRPERTIDGRPLSECLRVLEDARAIFQAGLPSPEISRDFRAT